MIVVLFLGGFLLISLGANLIGFRYWLNIWYATDVLVNAVLAGDPHETISSRWGKAIARGNRPAIWIARLLFLTEHFESAINEDVGRHRVPVAMCIVGIVWLAVAIVVVFR